MVNGVFCVKKKMPKNCLTIIDALSDKERLKEMGEHGQLYVQATYRWEKVVDKMCNAMKTYKD